MSVRNTRVKHKSHHWANVFSQDPYFTSSSIFFLSCVFVFCFFKAVHWGLAPSVWPPVPPWKSNFIFTSFSFHSLLPDLFPVLFAGLVSLFTVEFGAVRNTQVPQKVKQALENWGARQNLTSARRVHYLNLASKLLGRQSQGFMYLKAALLLALIGGLRGTIYSIG